MGDLLYPAIPDPIATTESLLESIVALKQAVELLNGQRLGNGNAKAVTAVDLNYVFGTTPPTGSAPPPTTGVVNDALQQARLAVQSALRELEEVLNTSITEIQDEQQTALSELQAALDTETGLRIDGDNAIMTQVEAIILTNDEGAVAAIAQETALRIAADDALAGQITSLSATVDGNSAAISNEAVARASGDSSLATQISTVTAIASKQRVFVQSTPPTGTLSTPLIIGDLWIDVANGNLLKAWSGSAWVAVDNTRMAINTAAISSEAIARADADSAMALEIDTIISTVDGNTAAITQEALTRATADTALTSQVTTLSSTVGSNTAAISAEAATRANADSALSGTITTLQAQVTNNTASITNEAVARANGDSALAGQISTVSTVTGNNTAAITAETVARTNADTALTGQITTLSSQVGTNASNITAEASTRATQDAALATSISTVQSQTDTNASAITAEQTARTNADTAIANSVTSLSTTVNGHTATILTQQTSINGLAAEYSLTLNVNGHITGFQINDNSIAPSQFIIQADQFKIVSGAGGVLLQPFTVSGGNTYINRVIVNDEIISPNYVADALGNPAAGFRAGTDGKLRAEDARFTDFQARGGNFTERPVLLATPNFRNGVPEGLPSVRWVSSGSITVLGGSQLVSLFARTPDSVTLSATQTGPGGTYTVLQTFMVPPGHRLPPRMVADLPGDLNTYVWQDDGTIDRVTYNSNGAVTATVTAPGKWMYDVERDPLVLTPTNKMICGLGYTRYAQPLRIPTFLANGTTLVSFVSFKCWGAGGGHDENSGGQGGPGGYVAGQFTVSNKSGTGFLKHGDMIYLIVGEGGRSRSADVVFGFGGAGQALDSRSGGGGLSGVFRYSVTRANAMLIAGGGGGQTGSDTADGGPGGATGTNGSGGNGTTAANTDAEIMTGLPWSFSSNQRAGGGGGYVGGGYLPLGGNPRQAGRGGSNFVHASAASSANQFTTPNSNGNSTTTANPPNISDPDLVANDDCLGNAALAGRGKTSTVQAQQGGNGLIVVTFA